MQRWMDLCSRSRTWNMITHGLAVVTLGVALSERENLGRQCDRYANSLSGRRFQSGPMRTLSAGLIMTLLTLTALIWPSVASAQFDFTLDTIGPQNVVQGHPLYFVLNVTPTSGTSPTMIPITVSGLPDGATASFPDIAQTCCGTNQIYSLSSATSIAIQINTLTTTPVGLGTLNVSVTAGSVTHSVSYPFAVTAAPSALTQQAYAVATTAPQLALWQSNMTTYGQTFCAQLTDPSLTADQRLAVTYYDGQRVFYNIRDYTGVSTWDACAQSAQASYRDGYVIPNNGAVTGYWDFPHGLYQSYVRTTDGVSRNAVLLLSRNAAYGTSAIGSLNTMVSPARSREVSYHLMAYLLARAVGETQNPVGEAYLDLTLGYIDQWFVSKNFRTTDPTGVSGQFYVQPFMVALAAEALIQFYETQSQDVRIPAAVKTAMDWLWTNAWNSPTQAFWYDVYGPALGPYQTGNSAPDLNLLLAPAFAWLYKQTGDTTYRDRADAIFAGGVTGACSSCDGKHFNQQYRWSFDYLKWRNPNSVPAAPSAAAPVAPSGLSVR